jgi:hypothetical protein
MMHGLTRFALLLALVCFVNGDRARGEADPTTAPADKAPRKTTTSWSELRRAHQQANKYERGTVSVVGRDGIAISIKKGNSEPVIERFRVDGKTMILIAKNAPPREGDVVKNATTVRYVYGKLGEIRQGSRANVGWDGDRRAVFIEAIPFAGDIVIVGPNPPLEPTELPAPATQPSKGDGR